MSTSPILRFAPSPTGGFHVGNARTALFNYLYAKRYGATLKLRVEDTDKERSTDDALGTITDGLEWLGIEFDGTPAFQSKNEEAHRKAAERLLESGKAYRCYLTPEELEDLRKTAMQEKRQADFENALSRSEVEKRESSGAPFAVFFRIPPGETVWTDTIRGVQRWENSVLADFVIQRTDGSPIYNLAVVVDDHDMGVTLVLRAADHISNTPKQVLLSQALGWDVPDYAHSTLLLGDDGKKLSKRRTATTVGEYAEQGYLKEAVVNFLALLGWSPGDEREIFTLDELVDTFSVEGLSSRDTVFDEKKLLWLNGEHIRRKTPAELLPAAVAEWTEAGYLPEDATDVDRQTLLQIVELLQPRVEKLDDFRLTDYFFKDPDTYDDAALKKHWKTDTVERMTALIGRLEKLEGFSERDVEGAVRTIAGESGLSASKFIHPTRLMLCGVGHGPGLFELMEVLGRETSLRRMRRGLEVLSPETQLT